MLCAALLAYGCASGLAAVSVAARTDWRHLRTLPLAFAALHLSYGTGFLWGNWRVLMESAKRTDREANESESR